MAPAPDACPRRLAVVRGRPGRPHSSTWLAWRIATLFGGESHPPDAARAVPALLVTNYGEEIGWRGYALPKLQERMTPLAAALVLGVIWGAFHWIALAGNADAPIAYVAVGTAHLVAISVIMSYVFNGSGESVPAVTVLHAMYDTVAIGVAPLIETTVPLLAFASTAVIAWIVAIALVIRTGTELGFPRDESKRVESVPA